MEKTKMQKLEESYLAIFKFLVIVLLSLAILGSLVLIGKGVVDLMEKPSPVEPERAPPTIKLDVEQFLNQLPKAEAPDEKVKEPSPKTEDTDSKKESLVDEYIQKLWGYFNGYQQQCQAAIQVDKDTFIKAFPKRFITNWFDAYGIAFLDSQDKLAQAVLAHPRAIQICKDRKGRGGVFIALLNWHRMEWVSQRDGIAQFIREEKDRVTSTESAEAARVVATHARGNSMLLAALMGFGSFMSLALLLILSKIESNLREIVKGNSDLRTS